MRDYELSAYMGPIVLLIFVYILARVEKQERRGRSDVKERLLDSYQATLDIQFNGENSTSNIKSFRWSQIYRNDEPVSEEEMREIAYSGSTLHLVAGENLLKRDFSRHEIEKDGTTASNGFTVQEIFDRVLEMEKQVRVSDGDQYNGGVVDVDHIYFEGLISTEEPHTFTAWWGS
eukprot:CAMPEP_0185020900 /NCGR_PEP_ID=MMETSP1103-20130426/3549_1 /TAXON_ID=36769 /ORGANISM="Paraphysomonas bandaiensis, Strain Caron Lab Isolate" /LENGTH=174 /DNA_ID=CAMNT_0027552087 /DNA_START=9 /DNA_END=533 /DNA_ORIENTATION=+